MKGNSLVTDDLDRTNPHVASSSRRRFIKEVAAAGALAAAPAFVRPLRGAWQESSQSSLFTLGVASGDPKEDSVVIWTRLAPDPLNGGGMGNRTVGITWQIASDPGMNNVVKAGVATASPRNGHAVSVTVDGLRDETWYYYQFSYAGERSRIGRTRTFPSPGTTPS